MSNFICPTCGITNYDCGKAGYKTDREIELEKKLEIAVNALEEYGNRVNWDKDGVSFGKYTKGWIMANKSLAKIKELDK